MVLWPWGRYHGGGGRPGRRTPRGESDQRGGWYPRPYRPAGRAGKETGGWYPRHYRPAGRAGRETGGLCVQPYRPAGRVGRETGGWCVHPYRPASRVVDTTPSPRKIPRSRDPPPGSESSPQKIPPPIRHSPTGRILQHLKETARSTPTHHPTPTTTTTSNQKVGRTSVRPMIEVLECAERAPLPG